MAVSPPPLFTATPVQPEDRLRFAVTLLFSIAFILALGVYLYAAFATSDNAWARIKEAFGVILPALTGSLGTALGFYFGNRK